MSLEKTEDNVLPPLHYSLFDLPSAQHKAGLAGLLVMIESMHRRGLEPVPRIIKLGPAEVTISLTRESLQCLYDFFFASQKDDEGKIVPKAEFLQIMKMPPLWSSLWRDVITRVLRAGAPAQMKSFRDRSTPEKPPRQWDWEKMWDHLEAGKRVDINGTDMVGIESVNAAKVKYVAPAKEALLLTFWPVVSLPYVTQKLTTSKSGRVQDYLFSYYAYVMAIPEVACLDEFVQEIFELYPQSLCDDAPGKAPRPAQSLVSTEKEAALLFASRQYGCLDSFPVLDMVSCLQIIHLKYGKGSPDILDDSVVVPTRSLVKEYRKLETGYFNPLFKKQLIENLFMRQPWYHGMYALFVNHPKGFFIQCPDSPKNIYGFFQDLKKKFFYIHQYIQSSAEEGVETEENKEDQLALRIRSLVSQYIRRKAEKKSRRSFKDFQKDENRRVYFSATYREAVKKICMDIFLAMRGRRGQDFVEYFTGTLCSVPQNLSNDDFLLISQALINEWDKVKTLSMLAVSACS
ncbi:MAG: type I-MYXAN CRISPR-associated protein Cmx8, partial [Candidatus Electrothrix sp. ATG2]|nr:type I-MYXAN CRISPR-associated protein Cmx8 [Candidatus Electrothrix sp. ATG2]